MKHIAINLLLWLIGTTAAVSAVPQSTAGTSPLSARTASQLSALSISSAKYRPDSIISAYLTVDPTTLDRQELEAAGVQVTLDKGTIITARLPLSALSSLGSVAGVKYIQTATGVHAMLDVARPEVGIDLVNGGTGETRPYTGKGVIVGVVDAGFDYNHAAFRDSEGRLRISRVWEQWSTPTAAQSSPEGYGYGVELTTDAEIETAGGDTRNNSHGTHVTAIAAGSDPALDGTLRGMAPDAELVLVSYGSDGGANVNISNAIAYIFAYADAVGKPCVINLSLGAHDGPHDGTSTFDTLADALQGPGRLIVGSAGNHRADKFHITRVFDSADDDVVKSFLDFKGGLSSSSAGASLEVWSSGDIEVALSVVNTQNSSVTDRTVIYPAEIEEPVTLSRNVTGNVSIASELSPLNGKRHVVVTSSIKSIRANYSVAIEVTPKEKGQVDIWADNTKLALTSHSLPGYTEPSGSTIAEIGGTAERILTVGAYTTRSRYTLFNETAERTLSETDGTVSSFSSCGPTADGRVKPNVSAPGCLISSAVSSNDASGTLLISYAHQSGERNNMYGYMQGTSMSSPMVAGIVATWLEAYPQLTPEQLLEVVKHTSRSDEHTGDLSEPSNDWGYGKIDALKGLRACLALKESEGIEDVSTDSYTEPIAYIAGGELHLILGSSVATATIAIYNAAGTLEGTRSISNLSAGEEITLPVPAGNGIHIIKVTTPKGHTTLKAL